MRTPMLLAQAQLRRGWTSMIGVVVLIALVGGLVLAGFAGAQRTRTAVDRMIEATDASDVLVNPNEGDETVLDFDSVAALPMVADFSRIQGVGVFAPGPYESLEDLFATGLTAASVDGRTLFEFDRPVMQSGRVPDPASIDEIYLDRTYAESEDLAVGDTVELRAFPYAVLGEVFELVDAGEFDEALAVLNDPAAGRTVALRVSGVGSQIDGVAVDEGYEPIESWIGPSLFEELGSPSAGFGAAVVHLRSPDDLDEFTAAVDAMAPDEKIVYATLAVTRSKAQRATQPAATALAIFAVVTALLGMLLVGQAISRRLQLDARDNATLAAIGTTRRERFAAAMIRLTLAALAGIFAAVVIATALSWFTPVGPATIAEPDPGFRFDPLILVGGAAVLLVVVLVVAMVPAWRSARQLVQSESVSGSKVANWLSGTGAPASVTTGVRFGLEPGRGRTAVPTRATIIGALTAVAVAAATMVFASSLDRVVEDGRFYGSNFDLAVTFDGDGEGEGVTTDDDFSRLVDIVAADAAVDRVSEMRITEIRVDGAPVTTLSFIPGSPSVGTPGVEPTIAEGRAPSAADEIALGRSTMRDLGVGVGDTVTVRSDGFTGDAQVVGRAVLPGVGLYQGSDRTSIGVGAIVAPESLAPRDSADKSSILVRLADDADRAAFETRVGEALSAEVLPYFQADGRPSDIEGLARLRSLPVLLAVLLVVLVAVTVVHAMVVAVRRRRRDVAILQALGSSNRSITAIGVWQGITIGIAALLFGVPLGIVAGRWFWTLLANEFGTLAEPVVPVPGVTILVASVLVLAALAGVVPIRRGLRHSPGQVLRSE